MLRLRHFAKLHKEDVVIIGFHKGKNSCLVVQVDGLPQDEGKQLRQIASSIFSQQKDVLVPILQSERHKSGMDWFTYLASRLRRGECVLDVPIKELVDMHPGQKAFWKGFGKSAMEEAEEMARSHPHYVEDEEEETPEISTAELAAQNAPAVSSMDTKMDVMINRMANLNNTIAMLAQVMAHNAGHSVPVAPATPVAAPVVTVTAEVVAPESPLPAKKRS